jgi:hypothetical protein
MNPGALQQSGTSGAAAEHRNGAYEMSMKLIGQIGIILGAVATLLSLAANPLGIGSNPNEFGWLQSLGAVLGLLTIAGGVWLTLREKPAPAKPKGRKSGKTRTKA